LPVVATEGCRIRLADGRTLIDGISSWWTACHGYNHPHIVRAVGDQLARMPHVMFGGLTHEPASRLAARLARLLPRGLDRVFFSDSGSVAVEVALKMALQFWLNRGEKRYTIIAFRNAYHGDTLGAMSVSDLSTGMHRRFRRFVPEQQVVDLPQSPDELSAFAAELDGMAHGVAAVILEPLVQAAGGMRMHEPAVIAGIAQACDDAGVMFIADEIATGFGRTGTLFACEQAGVAPDIVCLGKALTGGALGLAATVAQRHVFEAFLSDDPDAAFMHGPTFMANPLACAAANASLDLFETEPRLTQVAAIEAHLREALAECRGVADVRVKGAIGAVELGRMPDPQWLRDRFVAEGVWVRPLGNVIYLMPPFVIAPDELATLTGAVVRVVREAARRA
jgi:adenosylmethionine-8-amino-7-oxononanoate aminotransferase